MPSDGNGSHGLYQIFVFYVDRKSKMATTAGHTGRLTLNPTCMGKCSNAFFSETTNMIKAKLYMNVHRGPSKEHSC
jgi:hypothetical protein